MDFDDDDALDLLDDDGDGVNEMCLLFDEDGDKEKPTESTQGTGCGLVMLCLGAGAVSVGVLSMKMII